MGYRTALQRRILHRPILLTVVILGGLVVQYWLGPRTVLGSVGTRRVDATEHPDLHATVTRLSSQIDIAKPKSR
nr:hypothetical protein [Natronorubrum halalkaliphilum]